MEAFQFSPRLMFQPVYHILVFLRAVLPCDYESVWSVLWLHRVIPALTAYSQLNSLYSEESQLNGGKVGCKEKESACGRGGMTMQWEEREILL